MWPWKKQAHDDERGTLSRRLDDVESATRLLKSEWVDVLDRLERIAGRLAKRAERDGHAAGVLTGPEPPPAPTGAPAASPGSRALADVLKRRGGRAA